MRSLTSLVKNRPFPEFTHWWRMGDEFIHFMSSAIGSEWRNLDKPDREIDQVQNNLGEYFQLVYGKTNAGELLDGFLEGDISGVFHSGEFDALSYALYRSAFEVIAARNPDEVEAIKEAQRDFTRRVGKKFFKAVQEHLPLTLPSELETSQQLGDLEENIERLGEFLLRQGYLRDQCDFSFNVDVVHNDEHLSQNRDVFLERLNQYGIGYALYIMGYPAILPSAVYLYQMYGEAQHHSSRTIEEIFSRLGLQANESEDFDPSTYPADRIVELWKVYK